MFKQIKKLAVAVMLAGGLFASPAVQAEVHDHAGMFSKSAITEANEVADRMQREYKHQVTVETFKEIPQDLKGKYDEKNKKAFFQEWARKRAKDQHVEGVYVLICDNPKYLQPEVGSQTRRIFSEKSETEFGDILKKNLKNNPNEALVKAVQFVDSTFSSNWSKVQDSGRPVPNSPVRRANPVMANNNLAGWVCFGLLGIMGLWMIVGLFRGMSGGGMGGPGMGYGMGAPGGGGGFMSSLLGGMFGAAAGMWIYDSMFGHGSSSAWGAGNSMGAGNDYNTGGIGDDTDYSSADNAGGNWGDDNSGNDGNWGDNDSGGNGGGDWGGGDWGGGGGDFGGGGGDW